MRYNIGDKVRISKKSIYYGLDRGNPKDIDGEIVEIDETSNMHPIRVMWENTHYRHYRERDLKLRRRE